MRIAFIWVAWLAGVATAATPASFETTVQPLLREWCSGCHNQKVASGGLNVAPFLQQGPGRANRDGWERIVAKIARGGMPPPGAPRPAADRVDALLKFMDAEFDRLDKSTPKDPGRVTARRLNRAEYANTIRDLLGVHFRAAEEFPPDDSSHGFDNIAEVLTVSPTLLQTYLSAAEKIAARAVGADPLPKPGVFDKKSKVKRKDTSSIEVTDAVEYSAEYVVRAQITGHRGQEGKPVTLVISVDGQPLKTVPVSSAFTLVNRQGGATQRTSEEVRTFLPEGPHTFRAEFLNDEFVKTLASTARMNSSQNMYPETIEIVGPFPAAAAASARKSFLVCDPASGDACIERILSTLSQRAFRRPVTRAEVATLTAVAKRASRAGYAPGQSLQFAITTLLVSPQFLFRIERDPRPGPVGRITDLELASRLSYFLWSSTPDAALLSDAEAGRLHLPAILDGQVKRMLADQRSSALAENFAGQWLELRSLEGHKPDAAKFPEWNNDLRDAMRTETTMFFDAVQRENRPISDFIDAKYTFLNEALAKHYGIEGVAGPDFRRVALTTDQRSGLLTQASVLTVSSYAARTSVVLRGKFLLENILGGAPPAAPPDVPALDEAAVGTQQSLREQMEKHRTNAVCASCHARMDVLGFGLENYDPIGRWRTQDGKFPVDSSGTFPGGKSFAKPAEMKALLRASLPDFAANLSEKMLTYALGRGIESYDRPAIREITRQTVSNDYRFQSLIHAIVRSVPFQSRRAETQQEAARK